MTEAFRPCPPLNQSPLQLFNQLQCPVWVISLETMSLHWSNHAGQKLWPRSSLRAWIKHAQQGRSDRVLSRVDRVRQALAEQQTWTEQWTFYRQGELVSMPCLCSALSLDACPEALLLVEGLDERLEPALARALRLTETNLQQRDATMLAVGEAMRSLLGNADSDQAISHALQLLGSMTHVDRAYIFKNHPHPVTGDLLTSQRWEWTYDRVTTQIDNLELHNISYQALSPEDWLDPLRSDCCVSFRLRDLPAGHPLVEFLGAQQIQSILALPILLQGNFWGFLGFDRCRTDQLWTEAEQNLLRLAAAAIGCTILRHQSEVKLASFNTQIEALVEQRTLKLRAAVQQLQQEIHERERAESQLRYNALHDRLTGLPNRAFLMEELGRTIAQLQTTDSLGFAILFVDIDRFKVINDSLGHQVGDELLVAIAHRLRRCLRPVDSIARLDGDEFAILLRDVGTRTQAEQVAEAIHRSLARPVTLGSQEIFTSVSIGIALGSREYNCAELLLRDADIFMRRAKAMRSRHEVFDRAVHQQVLTTLRLEYDLRRAIAQIEEMGIEQASRPEVDLPFSLRYQPIAEAATGYIYSFEALLRWNHPELGPVAPDRFIAIAEETGLIVTLGLWTLYRACYQLSEWQRLYPELDRLRMAVNLSAKQFSRLDLIEQIDQVLHRTGIHPGTLKLEITETTIADNSDLAEATMHELRARRITICMDDFGTGYSSLSYLHRFPLDVIKIDRSFIAQLGGRDNTQAIVRAIITLAEHLGMQTIAEGVEQQEQLQWLAGLGCTYIQGYWLAKPLSARGAGQLLVQRISEAETLRQTWPAACPDKSLPVAAIATQPPQG
ncbi:MAG: EAL domain-containing protein [Oscillatoriales cyanobacterium]|nr:MAG: EAL domain-containing protein [Oscillatoriales cyanobacterium]